MQNKQLLNKNNANSSCPIVRLGYLVKSECKRLSNPINVLSALVLDLNSLDACDLINDIVSETTTYNSFSFNSHTPSNKRTNNS